jgi:hypothetical protein
MAAQDATGDPTVRVNAQGGTYKLNVGAWPTERWVGVVTLAALALLILIRRGFRGVNVLGVRAGVS